MSWFGPHPAPLAVAAAAIATVGATLLDGADIVETVLKARRENIPQRRFRSRIIRKMSLILLLWIALGTVFTPMPNLFYLIPLAPRGSDIDEYHLQEVLVAGNRSGAGGGAAVHHPARAAVGSAP